MAVKFNIVLFYCNKIREHYRPFTMIAARRHSNQHAYKEIERKKNFNPKNHAPMVAYVLTKTMVAYIECAASSLSHNRP